MTTPAPDVSDVAVIGAGIVGAAIARDLAGTGLSVTLVEARDDVGDGTSKANTALLHTGFDATPGTLESRLVARGYDLLGDYAEQTGIPIERTGALLVAWTDEEARRTARAARTRRNETATRHAKSSTPKRCTAACPNSALAPWADSPCLGKPSSAPGPPIWRWPPTPCSAE